VFFFLFNIFTTAQCMKTHFFIQDTNCICHAPQSDTTQAMLWSVIQYDPVFPIGPL